MIPGSTISISSRAQSSLSSSPHRTTLRILVWRWLKHFILPPVTSTHTSYASISTDSLDLSGNHTQSLGLPSDFPFLSSRMTQLFHWIQLPSGPEPDSETSTTDSETQLYFWVHFEFHRYLQVLDSFAWSVHSSRAGHEETVVLGWVVVTKDAYEAHSDKIDDLLILLSMISSVVNEINVSLTLS
ncbi:hypothetical protein D9758_014215 [Tetrapyrgos nigripes]|uniref:Uncharacterized protein n=1 Tax=Tetrapyrgos nigripes TaxID=182062 RepID=A0A8H5CW42_9AGAR|nr:hypothetical protein D9758_014215 [Tetrapyrgos nigripes]